MNGLKNNISNQEGMTLFEVMMAITLWAIFYIAFVSNQNYNILDSQTMNEELILKNLCESKINEIILDPPPYNQALTLSKETKSFENEYSDYEYTIEYRQIELPNMEELLGEADENQVTEQQQIAAAQQIQKVVSQKLKENVEQIIWQVAVTVTNKTTNFSYTLSSWVKNHNAKINFNF